MTDKPNDILLLAGKVLTILMQGFMAFAALTLVITGPLVVVMSDTINAEMVAEYGSTVAPMPVSAILGLFACALVAVALVFFFFGKLRAIISTVAEGEPFLPDNADRLNAMAWLLAALQVAKVVLGAAAVPVATWASALKSEDLHISTDFSSGFDLTSILMVVVLFILARVFRHGAAMREDLEGTV
ncbi:DUF2975 domain-containing protein [Erythrobacter sp. sf7]|uniref:DUF2975 domain-containing protein n=1 Tax=Erythrobacter fulvus TaxID=2987523 RepID=A0ABT5JRI5_9SPHN|nr:DUF2975 domain-containing protein [Erythrobacter fulvus]MDC8755378.1 DUF2975 domain-containing protein [Erythrobacter fulvus]